jgi:hypothetical protein
LPPEIQEELLRVVSRPKSEYSPEEAKLQEDFFTWLFDDESDSDFVFDHNLTSITVGKTVDMPDHVKEDFIEEANKYIDQARIEADLSAVNDLLNKRTEEDDPVGYYQFSLRSIE